MDGIEAGQELTAGQLELAAAAIGGRPAGDILGDLGLGPLQHQRAVWWLASIRESLIDLVLRHLNGYLDFGLDPAALGRLIGYLLDDQVTDRVRRVVLTVLQASDDDELTELFDDPGLMPALRQAIPVGDQLRGELDQFFADRIDADGQARTGVQRPRSGSLPR